MARWLLPRNNLGANHVEITAAVLLSTCLFECVYLATRFCGSIAQFFGHNNSSSRYIAVSLKLFVPNSLQEYRHFVFPMAIFATSVLGLTLNSVARVSRWLLSNRSRWSLLKTARPERFLPIVPVDPVLSPTSSSVLWGQKFRKWSMVLHQSRLLRMKFFLPVLERAGSSTMLTFLFRILRQDTTVRFTISGPSVFPILLEVLSFFRPRYSFKPQSPIPSMPSGFGRRLFPNVRPV
jgi:hypothetical protein